MVCLEQVLADLRQLGGKLPVSLNLLPNGVPLAVPTITPAEQADYLRAAACLRSHGFPGFPDPAFHHNAVSVNIPSSINQHSAQFESAATTCAKLIPSGLPNIRPGGS